MTNAEIEEAQTLSQEIITALEPSVANKDNAPNPASAAAIDIRDRFFTRLTERTRT